jgi:hypothetical protein
VTTSATAQIQAIIQSAKDAGFTVKGQAFDGDKHNLEYARHFCEALKSGIQPDLSFPVFA